MTATMGRGVFAARRLAKGETLAEFHTIRLPPEDVTSMRTTLPGGGLLSHFWFEDDADGAAFVVLGWIEMVNHATAPNTDRSWRVTPEGEVVTVSALRDIEQGEQLFINYHFEPHAHNPAWAER
jgi:SET domain-containing protein